MRYRRWTVLFVPHGSERSRSFSLSERSLRSIGGLASVLALAVVLGGGRLLDPTPVVDADALARENLALRQQLTDLRQQIAGVQDTLTTLARRDGELRSLAGLPPMLEDMSPRRTTPISTSLRRGTAPFSRLPIDGGADIDGLVRRATSLSTSFQELSSVLQRNVERLAATPSIMPTAGWLTSNFSRSRFHPILHESRPHEGIDVSASMGAPIVAPAVGIVTRAETDPVYGQLVEIDHGNGIVTKYAHCSRITVQPGQRVTRGQVIAAVGNSGLSSGPHLHYEIRVNGQVVDPLTYVLR